MRIEREQIMKIDSTAIYLPRKKMKDVKVGEIFSTSDSPDVNFHMRILKAIDHKTFYVLSLGYNEFYEPSEQQMESDVYSLDGVLHVSMLRSKQI